jgi:sulfur-carrier protein
MKFIFSGALLRFVGFAKEIEISEPNLELALKALLAQRPALRPALLAGEGTIRRSHQMFVNGETVEPRYFSDPRARGELVMDDRDSVFFLTAIAGG